MLKPSTSKLYFTSDIGMAKNDLLFGPLVLTHINSTAEVQVTDGHYVDDPADAPILTTFKGDNFHGSFFVKYGWSIKGITQKALVSGFYPYPNLPLQCKLPHTLACGAQLFYNYHRDSNLVINSKHVTVGRLEAMKKDAIRQAEELMGCAIAYTDWELYAGETLNLAFRPDVD